MTTKHSPLNVLKAQADKIAAMLKAAERGEPIGIGFAAKLEEARGKEHVTFGIVMDDKVIKITLPWQRILETGEVGLSELILKLMRETRDAVH